MTPASCLSFYGDTIGQTKSEAILIFSIDNITVFMFLLGYAFFTMVNMGRFVPNLLENL